MRPRAGYVGFNRTPTTTAASGVWLLREAETFKRAGTWPIAGDPYFADVSLLLHMDGTNGGTTFTDSSGTPKSVEAFNAQVSTAQSKFGGASAFFDGSEDFLLVSDSSALTFGTGDFTVEFWIYPLAYGGSVCGAQLFGNTSGSTSGWSFHLGESQDAMRLTSDLSGSWVDDLSVSAGGGPALNEWSHIALVRSGASVTIYKNGSSVASMSSAGSFSFGGGPFVIGVFNDGDTFRDLHGYIDELRVTKGVARYTANFTPPAAPFPDA